MTQILEGTWDEIAAHKQEWNGKRRMRDVWMELAGTVEGLPADSSEKTGEAFAAAEVSPL